MENASTFSRGKAEAVFQSTRTEETSRKDDVHSLCTALPGNALRASRRRTGSYPSEHATQNRPVLGLAARRCFEAISLGPGRSSTRRALESMVLAAQTRTWPKRRGALEAPGRVPIVDSHPFPCRLLPVALDQAPYRTDCSSASARLPFIHRLD